MNKKVTNINSRNKKNYRTLEQIAREELEEYRSNETDEPDGFASGGDMSNILKERDESDEDNNSEKNKTPDV